MNIQDPNFPTFIKQMQLLGEWEETGYIKHIANTLYTLSNIFIMMLMIYLLQAILENIIYE